MKGVNRLYGCFLAGIKNVKNGACKKWGQAPFLRLHFWPAFFLVDLNKVGA